MLARPAYGLGDALLGAALDAIFEGGKEGE